MALLRRIRTREQALAVVGACARLSWLLPLAGGLLLAGPQLAGAPLASVGAVALQVAMFGCLGWALRRFRHHLAAALLLSLAGLALIGAVGAFAARWAASEGPLVELLAALGILAYGGLLWAATRASEATVKLRGRFSSAWQQADPGFSLFSRIETRGQACAVIDDSSRGFILLQVVGLLSSCTHRHGVYGEHSLAYAAAVAAVAYLMGRFRSRAAAALLLSAVGGTLVASLLDLRGAVGQGFWSGAVGLAVSAFLVFAGARALEATVRLARGLPEGAE